MATAARAAEGKRINEHENRMVQAARLVIPKREKGVREMKDIYDDLTGRYYPENFLLTRQLPGRKCDDCGGINIINNCPFCGAPICCLDCCVVRKELLNIKRG